MPTSSFSSTCPRCGRRAPIVLRGLDARCAACGKARLPLSAPTMSLAGQPSRIGGTAAFVAGWAVLILGLSLAAAVALLLQSIWPALVLGWAFGIPIAAASLFFGLLLILGGRGLKRRGEERQRQVQLEGLRGLLAHRGNTLSAAEAGEALHLPEAEADALLMDLAKAAATDVTIDPDDDGQLRYRFGTTDDRWRVLEEKLRVDERLPAEVRNEPVMEESEGAPAASRGNGRARA